MGSSLVTGAEHMSWPDQPTPGIILARPVNPVNRFRQIAALVSFDTSTNGASGAIKLGLLGLGFRSRCFRLPLFA